MSACLSGALSASRLLTLPLFLFTASPLKVLLVLQRLPGFFQLLTPSIEATLSRRHRFDAFERRDLEEPHSAI